MNLVNNASFEGTPDPVTGNVPGWTRGPYKTPAEYPPNGLQPPSALWTFDGDFARTGDNSFDASAYILDPDLQPVPPVPDRRWAEIQSDPFTVVDGAEYHVRAWFSHVKIGLGDQDESGLTISVDPGDGVFVEVARLTCDAMADDWGVFYLLSGLFTANGTSARVRVASLDRATEGQSILFVDDVEVEPVAAAKRRVIKEAVVSQLATITQANGYETDVAEVVGEYKPERAIESYPAINITYAAEEKSFAAMHRRRGDLMLLATLYANGDDADNTCDDLAKDIEVCLETQTAGQFLGLGYVNDVTVEEIIPAEMQAAEHRDVRVWVVRLLVWYEYDRADP